MNRDDIIRMAREAGICTWLKPPEDVIERIERFAALAAAAEREKFRDEVWEKAMKLVSAATKFEREACAKVCEDSVEYAGDTLADAIRARGQA